MSASRRVDKLYFRFGLGVAIRRNVHRTSLWPIRATLQGSLPAQIDSNELRLNFKLALIDERPQIECHSYGDRCGLSVSSVTQLVLGKEMAIEIIFDMSASWIMRERSLPVSLTDGVFTKPG